jgi:hypothetical protein
MPNVVGKQKPTSEDLVESQLTIPIDSTRYVADHQADRPDSDLAGPKA